MTHTVFQNINFRPIIEAQKIQETVIVAIGIPKN